VVSSRQLCAPFSARDESLQKVPRNDDVVVIVDTEEGDENSDITPVLFLLLGASLI
jgi:hypothetical protein